MNLGKGGNMAAICDQCQVKILREIVMHKGGCVPLNALGCEYYFDHECEWEKYAQEIIRTFEKEYKKIG